MHVEELDKIFKHLKSRFLESEIQPILGKNYRLECSCMCISIY